MEPSVQEDSAGATGEAWSAGSLKSRPNWRGEAWTPWMMQRALEMKSAGSNRAEIAQEIGVSYNAVVGKLYRWDMAQKGIKPSHRKKPGGAERRAQRLAQKEAQPAPVEVAPAVTLPPLVSLTEPVEAAVSVATVRNHTEPSSDEKPTLGYVWSAPKPKPVNVSTAVCQWPSDIPGTRRFTLCGCPVERHGRPYCGAHADKAYIRSKVVYAD